MDLSVRFLGLREVEVAVDEVREVDEVEELEVEEHEVEVPVHSHTPNMEHVSMMEHRHGQSQVLFQIDVVVEFRRH